MKIQLELRNNTDYSPLCTIDLADGSPQLIPLPEDLIQTFNGDWKRVLKRRFAYEDASITVFLECCDGWPMEDPRVAAERRRQLREQEPPELRKPRYTGRDGWMG
jgi:hypothetical protein